MTGGFNPLEYKEQQHIHNVIKPIHIDNMTLINCTQLTQYRYMYVGMGER